MYKHLKSFFKRQSKSIKEVDSKRVRRAMVSYFHGEVWNYQYTITKVETFETKEGLLIKIETHRPGLLIGTGGNFIDGLKKWLSIDLKRSDIAIELKESMVWHNLY